MIDGLCFFHHNFWRFRQEWPPRTLNGKPLVLDHLLGVSRLQDGLGHVLEYIYIILHHTHTTDIHTYYIAIYIYNQSNIIHIDMHMFICTTLHVLRWMYPTLLVMSSG